MTTGTDTPQHEARSPANSLITAFARWRARFVVPVERQSKVTANVADGAALAPRYSFMIVMACGIAILGLLQNSAAVIIGAMLISPLMGPIVALGFSLCVLDFDQMRRSLVTLAVGVALALAIAILIVSVSPLREATPEILARTQPTLFDLLVAVFSGLAGGYAVVQGRGETIVGVAIATALMPPLAVTGYGIATGQAGIAGGAAFLFMTNLLAIALSVTIVARWYGFGTHNSARSAAWQAGVILLTFAALSIPLGLSLTSIAKRGWVERAARTEIEAFLRSNDARLASMRIGVPPEGKVTVDIVALTSHYEPAAARQLSERLRERLSRQVSLSMEQVVVAEEDPQDTARRLEQLQARLNAMQQSVAARDPVSDFQARLTNAVSEQLGAVSLDTRERLATVYLRPGSTMSLADAQALETRLAGVDQAWKVSLIPPVQSLPALYFDPDSTSLDEEHVRSLETAAWALRRWKVSLLEAVGFASSDGAARHNRALAATRAQVVADWLETNGFEVRAQADFDRRSQGDLERELGMARFRRVELRPQVIVAPLPDAPTN